MNHSISLNADRIHQLDLSPVVAIVDKIIDENISSSEGGISFAIDYPREETDPRELSEIPEIRLWFLRLDTCYPWLPFLLDWKDELPRYIAMLVPHQFHRTDGIIYNPEALEIAIAQKTFIIYDWLHDRGIEPREKLKFMWMTVGYDLDDSFFEIFLNN
ncbi:MAG: CRR6 family NdhI maturation factor [Cyanobacteria bacterium P01_E01_bin.42]